MLRSYFFVLLLGLAATTGGPATAKELYKRQWLEARSPNFLLISSLKEKPTRTLAEELEDFRQIVGAFTNATSLEPRVPTVLFVFPGPVRDIGLVEPIAGFFHPGMRANFAVARPAGGLPLSHTIQHEYTHFVVRNQGSLVYPRWYDEGVAEWLATVNLRHGQFDLGNGSAGRMYSLNMGNWMRYSRLLDDEQTVHLSREEGEMFYAESWALVHYLTARRTSGELPQQLGKYLAARERGTAPIPAFEESFGEDVSTLDTDVRRYLTTAKFAKGTLKHPFDAGQVAVRKMETDEVAAALGHLCILTNHLDEALRYVDAALAANPRNARALVDRADLHKFAAEYAQAEPLYRRAIDIEPETDQHHLDFGEYWFDRATEAAEDAQRAQFLSLARHEFVRAHELNDENPETLTVYGSSFLMEGQDPAKGIDTLELAHQLLPSHPTIKLNLARAYIATNRPRDARPLLLAVRTWEGEGGASVAEKLLAEIDEAEPEEESSKEPAAEAP